MSCNCFIKTSCSISPLVLPEDASRSLDVSQREGRSTFVPAQDVCLLSGKPCVCVCGGVSGGGGRQMTGAATLGHQKTSTRPGRAGRAGCFTQHQTKSAGPSVCAASRVRTCRRIKAAPRSRPLMKQLLYIISGFKRSRRRIVSNAGSSFPSCEYIHKRSCIYSGWL